MEASKSKAYEAGALGVLIGVIFAIMAFNTGWNLSGQVIGIFSIFFGGLGVLCFAKPDFAGPILSNLLDNIARNMREQSKSYNQTQRNPHNSPQVFAENGSVNITQNIYSDSNKKRKM